MSEGLPLGSLLQRLQAKASRRAKPPCAGTGPRCGLVFFWGCDLDRVTPGLHVKTHAGDSATGPHLHGWKCVETNCAEFSCKQTCIS